MEGSDEADYIEVITDAIEAHYNSGDTRLMLAPRTPTEEMLDAAWESALAENASGVWESMFNAWCIAHKEPDSFDTAMRVASALAVNGFAIVRIDKAATERARRVLSEGYGVMGFDEAEEAIELILKELDPRNV